MTKKKKVEKTPEEIAEHLRIKKINSNMRKLTTIVKNNCSTIGLRAMELQYDWIKSNPTQLPFENLSREQTIEAWGNGIEKYKENIGLVA